DEIGDTHRQRADDRAEESERGQRDGGRVVKERPEQVLPDRPERRLRQAERLGDRVNFRLEQDDVGGFASDVARLGDSDAKVGLGERGGPVDAVAGEFCAFAALVYLLHYFRLLFRLNLRKYVFFTSAVLEADG